MAAPAKDMERRPPGMPSRKAIETPNPNMPNTDWGALIREGVPVVPSEGPSRGDLRRMQETRSAPDAPTKPPRPDSTGPTGGRKTRRRGAGMMDKIRSAAKMYNTAEDEFGDAEDPNVDPTRFSGIMGKAMNDVGPMMEQLKKLKEMDQRAGRKTRRVSKNRGDIVLTLMAIRDQIKVYHWQTSKYARHIATNDLVASLDTNIDEFVEVYMGKYGRPKITKTIKLHNFSESAARAFVAKQTEFLTTNMPKMLKSTDSDLLNIRDTILADVNKTLYLFTLR